MQFDTKKEMAKPHGVEPNEEEEYDKEQDQSRCATPPRTNEEALLDWEIGSLRLPREVSNKSEWFFSPLTQKKLQTANSKLSSEILNTLHSRNLLTDLIKNNSTWCHLPSRILDVPVNVLCEEVGVVKSVHLRSGEVRRVATALKVVEEVREEVQEIKDEWEDEEVEGNGGLKVEEIRSSCDDHEMTGTSET